MNATLIKADFYNSVYCNEVICVIMHSSDSVFIVAVVRSTNLMNGTETHTTRRNQHKERMTLGERHDSVIQVIGSETKPGLHLIHAESFLSFQKINLTATQWTFYTLIFTEQNFLCVQIGQEVRGNTMKTNSLT